MDVPDFFTAALPGVGGLVKAVPEDFVVEEIPAYPASGEGQHLLLTVEKRGITTREMVQRLATALGCAADDIGTAGMKDRQAVARQCVTVPAEGVDIAVVANLVLEGIAVLSAMRHKNKLRTGHLRGNRFSIVVRGVGPDALAAARAVLDALSHSWLPNRFGAQRFGHRGDNADEGRALIAGTRRVSDRFKKRLFISALQSRMFNRYLAGRIADGTLHRAIVGEVLQRPATGGLFLCAEAEIAYNQSRIDMRQVVPTGPMFGHAMFAPAEGSPAAEREAAILEGEGLTLKSFEPLGRLAEGTRRPLLVRLENATVTQEDDRLTVGFALPPGAYATVVLEEIMKPGAPLNVGGDP